jgi:hypothetical protein
MEMTPEELQTEIVRLLVSLQQEESIEAKNRQENESVNNEKNTLSQDPLLVTPTADQGNWQRLSLGLRSENPQEEPTTIGHSEDIRAAESPLIVSGDQECV